MAPVLHLLLALHHGSSFTSSLLPSHCRRRHTTRYYAFISKYLDFTDLLLLLLRRRLVAFTTLQPFRSCFFFLLCRRARTLSRSHCSHSASSLAAAALFTSLSLSLSLALASLHVASLPRLRSPLPSSLLRFDSAASHFANLEPRWRRLKFLIRNILPAPEGTFSPPSRNPATIPMLAVCRFRRKTRSAALKRHKSTECLD